MRFMPEISNCVLKSHDVLPSEPTAFRFSNVGASLGLLHWRPPNKHADSVTGYVVSITRISVDQPSNGDDDDQVRIERTNKLDHVLENLQPDSSSEVCTGDRAV
jgi:hypothetical protein